MSTQDAPDAPRLIAIDLGLKSGLAVYDQRGLLSYRATRFPSARAIKRAAWAVLCEVDALAHVFVEGDKDLAAHWRRAAEKQSLSFQSVRPEQWREGVLLPRQRRAGTIAKRAAMSLAHELIRASAAPAPKVPLTSDVAEAILIGYWATRQLGWCSSTVASGSSSFQ